MAHIYTIEDYEIGDESESLHLLVSEEQWSSIINIFSTNFSFPTRAPHWLFGERELRIPLMQSSCYFYWSQVVCLRSVRISLQHSTIDNLQHLRKLIPRKVTQCFLMSDSFIFISHSIQSIASYCASRICVFVYNLWEFFENLKYHFQGWFFEEMWSVFSQKSNSIYSLLHTVKRFQHFLKMFIRALGSRVR